jgi:FixJ family two-component response regulator
MSKVPFVSVINGAEAIRAAVARCIGSWVGSCGFAVEVFSSAEEFLSSKRLDDTACLIVDAHMRGMCGLQLQSHLASSGRYIPVIFIITIASLDETARARALEVGAVDFFRKPSGEEALRNELRSVLRLRAEDEKPDNSGTTPTPAIRSRKTKC